MKRGLALAILLILSQVAYGIGLVRSETQQTSLSPDQSTAIQSIEQGNLGSVQVGQARLTTQDGISGEVSGTVSRSSDGVRASQASVLRTPQGTVSDASGVHSSQDSLFFFSAKNFKSSLLSARGVSNGGWSGDTFSADRVDFISSSSPFPLSFDDSKKVSFKFSGNSLSSASFMFPAKKSYFMRNPFSSGKFVDFDTFSDSDGDGLSDTFELNNGLNAHSKDSDNDQLSDFEEVMQFPTDPKLSDTYTADALVDDASFAALVKRDVSVLGDVARQLSLSSVLQDSDDDDISDVNENRYNLNPKNFDSDGDGFTDGFELVRGMNALVREQVPSLALSSACSDCVFQLSGEDGSQISIDLSGFVGDVPGSKISYTVSKVQISLGSNAPNTVGGLSLLNLSINDTSKSASVTFEKTAHGVRVIATNEIGQTTTSRFSEKVFGDPLDFTINAGDGVLTAVLPSPGKYQYLVMPSSADFYGFLVDEERSFAQSFEVERPESLKPYDLFVDKQGLRQSFDLFKQAGNENSGFVSLVDHQAQLRGVFSYNRLGFEIGTNTWRSGSRNFVEHVRLNGSFLPVLESAHQLNVFTLLLDKTNVFAEVFGQLPLPVERSLLYFAYFDNVGVYEIARNAESTRLRRWVSSAPPVLRRLETNTKTGRLDVSDGVVHLILKDTPVQSFISSHDPQQRLFSQVLTNYRISTCDAYLSFEDVLRPVQGVLS